MQAYLKKHGTGHALHSLKVEWDIKGREMTFEFMAQKRSTRPWLSDSSFSHDWSKNWGLWSHDVIEVFLQLRSHENDLTAPYLEIQVSPLNQPFALIITEPRKIFASPKVLDFVHEVSVENKIWTSALRITLPPDLDGDLVYGGFFACLDHGPREYYALEPNAEENPDFHRPDLFLPLKIHE